MLHSILILISLDTATAQQQYMCSKELYIILNTHTEDWYTCSIIEILMLQYYYLHFCDLLVVLVRKDTESEKFPYTKLLQGEYLISALIWMLYSVSRVNKVSACESHICASHTAFWPEVFSPTRPWYPHSIVSNVITERFQQTGYSYLELKHQNNVYASSKTDN